MHIPEGVLQFSQNNFFLITENTVQIQDLILIFLHILENKKYTSTNFIGILMPALDIN